MWTHRPRVEEDSLRYLVVYIPWSVAYGPCEATATTARRPGSGMDVVRVTD